MVLVINLMRNFKKNLFENARLKLTAYYVAVLSVILVVFSGALVYTIDAKLIENLNGKIIITGDVEENPLDHTTDDIQVIIYYIDGVLLLVIAFASYFLAGKTLRPIKESLDAQKRFSADASHDLRTPLAIIMTESEVALQNEHNGVDVFKSIIKSNFEEAQKMSKLVNDLLIISRGENEKIINNYVTVDLHNFVNKIMFKIKVQAENKGLNLNINEYKKIMVKIDVNNFERAVLNILQNSIHYTLIGEIKINIFDDSLNAIVKISDTGVGISEEDLPFVFDRFYKAEHSRKDNSSSGLGLCISKQIIEQHNGNISIESKKNEGTKVFIKIPKINNLIPF